MPSFLDFVLNESQTTHSHLLPYLLAEFDLQEALVEVGAAVGAADEVLVLVALVLALGPVWHGTLLQGHRPDVWKIIVRLEKEQKFASLIA